MRAASPLILAILVAGPVFAQAPPSASEGRPFGADTGVRLGVDVALARHLCARGAADLVGALVRPRILLDEGALWEGPAFLGGLALGLVAPF